MAISASIGETLTLLGKYDTSNNERLSVEVDVTTNALDQFVVEALLANGGSFAVLASAAGDYTTVAYPLLFAHTFTTATGAAVDDDMTTIAADDSGVLIIDVSGIKEVAIYAASVDAAGSGTVMNCYRQ